MAFLQGLHVENTVTITELTEEVKKMLSPLMDLENVTPGEEYVRELYKIALRVAGNYLQALETYKRYEIDGEDLVQQAVIAMTVWMEKRPGQKAIFVKEERTSKTRKGLCIYLFKIAGWAMLKELGVEDKKRRNALKREVQAKTSPRNPIRLDRPMASKGNRKNDPERIIPDPHSPDPIAVLVDRERVLELLPMVLKKYEAEHHGANTELQRLEDAVSRISDPKHRMVMEYRWGFGCEIKEGPEIAKILGCSKQNVDRIEKVVIKDFFAQGLVTTVVARHLVKQVQNLRRQMNQCVAQTLVLRDERIAA